MCQCLHNVASKIKELNFRTSELANQLFNAKKSYQASKLKQEQAYEQFVKHQNQIKPEMQIAYEQLENYLCYFMNLYLFKLSRSEQEAVESSDSIANPQMEVIIQQFPQAKQFALAFKDQATQLVRSWDDINEKRLKKPPVGFNLMVKVVQITTDEFCSFGTVHERSVKANMLLQQLHLRIQFDWNKATGMKFKQEAPEPQIAICQPIHEDELVNLGENHTKYYWGRLKQVVSKEMRITDDSIWYKIALNRDVLPPIFLKELGHEFYVPDYCLIESKACYNVLDEYYRSLPGANPEHKVIAGANTRKKQAKQQGVRVRKEAYQKYADQYGWHDRHGVDWWVFDETNKQYRFDYLTQADFQQPQQQQNAFRQSQSSQQLKQSSGNADDDANDGKMFLLKQAPKDLSNVFQQDHEFDEKWRWGNTEQDCLVKAMCKSLGEFIIPSMKALVRVFQFYRRDEQLKKCFAQRLFEGIVVQNPKGRGNAPKQAELILPCFRQETVHLLELSLISVLGQQQILELVESPMQLEIELSSTKKYGGRPFLIVQTPDKLNHAYATRFSVEHGWQVTDEDVQEFFNIRDQPHMQRIFLHSNAIFIYAWHSHLQIPKDSPLNQGEDGVGFYFNQQTRTSLLLDERKDNLKSIIQALKSSADESREKTRNQ